MQNTFPGETYVEDMGPEVKYAGEAPDAMTESSADHVKSPLLYSELKSSLDNRRSASLHWAILSPYISTDRRAIQSSFVKHAEYSLAQTYFSIRKDAEMCYRAMGLSLRERLIERWKDTDIFFSQRKVKRVSYMSMEFLLGRSMTNVIHSLNLTREYYYALSELGIHLENIYSAEHDAGIGNGGLGRLAACFLDSLATLNYPAWGYGLRYTYGMFEQHIENGYQVEYPDYWLSTGDIWEIERKDVVYPVTFYACPTSANNRLRALHDSGSTNIQESQDGQFDDSTVVQQDIEANNSSDTEEVLLAVAYDVPIPGHRTFNTLNLRLWASKSSIEFDLGHFNGGDYFKSIERKQRSEAICFVLYPNDETMAGRELRLKQQYFFVSATLQDIVHRFKQLKRPMSEFHNFNAIQLNDTHPSLGIPELMRILYDQEHLSWEDAWDITVRTFAYTNHTIMPEALETWPVAMVEHLIPRIMSIIYEINHHFLRLVSERWPGDIAKLQQMSLIIEGPERRVRMAHLAIVGSHNVNGVAALHSRLLTTETFPGFYEIWPHKFTNVTNGVSPRRWIEQSNPMLSRLITRGLKSREWKMNANKLSGLRALADDPSFQEKWRRVRLANKRRFVKWVADTTGRTINEGALFDVHVKRFHEYKRQLLNILGVAHRYQALKAMSSEERAAVVPRVVIFSGKAAPGYYIAKLIIKLIGTVADVVNNDPQTAPLLTVLFFPNYNVSLAQLLVTISDISQHISTPGHEASGTSNMKFALNGGLLLATADGSTLEIADTIGADNIFLFGVDAEQVSNLRAQPKSSIELDRRYHDTIKALRDGAFGFFPEMGNLLDSFSDGCDHYLIGSDFASYLEIQAKIDEVFRCEEKWTRMSINSVAGIGAFSSDRTIHEYAAFWGIKPLARPGPVAVEIDRMSAAGLVPIDSSSIASGLSPSNSDVACERLSPLDCEAIRHFAPQGGGI